MEEDCVWPQRLLIGTQEIRFGRKTNEITKFSILDEKTKFTILDEIWTKTAKLSPNLTPSVIEVRRKGV